MIKFGGTEPEGGEKIKIAEKAKEYLNDILMYEKRIFLADLKELPEELLKKLESESLYLVVTLAKIDDLIKERWE